MLEQFAGEIIGVLSALVSAFVLYLFRPRVKLIFGRANNSRNVLEFGGQEGTPSHTEIYVEKFFLQNVGKVPATNVEFVLSNRPTDVAVWQPRDVRYLTVEKQNFMICIPQIAPQEMVVLDFVYVNQPASFVVSVKCAETLATEVRFQTVRQYPSFVNAIVAVLLFLGLTFIFQLIFYLSGADELFSYVM